MKKQEKIRIYLDFNIYNGICEKNIDKNIFSGSKLKTFLSVAHAEEYYKAEKNDTDGKNSNKLLDIVNEMVSLTPQGILNPSKSRVKYLNEKFSECLERVRKYDTTSIVKNNGEYIHKIQKESTKAYADNNKEVKNYSNLSCDEIWKQKEVVDKISTFYDYIEDYKKINFIQISALYGRQKARSLCDINFDGFELKKGCYSYIKDNYSVLECVVEFLNNILCECGYNRDKNVRTAISGIHDVQHLIYATYCNYFISQDKAFSKRANAIYTYLGIETKVIDISEFEKVIKK